MCSNQSSDCPPALEQPCHHATRATTSAGPDTGKKLGKLEKPWDAGLFKGADGLQKMADADAFWLTQPYRTRLYFGDGIADYLHRDVLRAAVKGLAGSTASSQVEPCIEEARLDQELPRRLFVVEGGSNGAAPSGCELVLDDVDDGNEERDYFLVSVVHGDPDVLKQMADRLAACWDLCHGIGTKEIMTLAGRDDAATLLSDCANASRTHLEARVAALEDLCCLAVGAVRDINAGFPMKELAVSVEQLNARAAELGVAPEG